MSTKVLQCHTCGQDVSCSLDVEKVTCSACIAEEWSKYSSGYIPTSHKRKGYPRGWKFKKLFVSLDGKVYHSGVEQPHLKGTLEPTHTEVKPKKTKAQKQQEKLELMAQLGKLKKELKKETRKTYAKKLESKIKKLQKKIK